MNTDSTQVKSFEPVITKVGSAFNAEDPRIYFAAERTLLAWLRTGIAVIGLGFLVARFGLFLAIARNNDLATQSVAGSTVLGTGFVWLGACLIWAATVQHVRFSSSLAPQLRPARYWMQFSVIVSASLAVLGTALGVYLVVIG